MNTKITTALCTGLLSMAMTTPANAALINMSFSAGSDSVKYVFDTAATDPFAIGEPGGLPGTALSLVSAEINVGGTTSFYDASNATLKFFNGEIASMSITDTTGGRISDISFDGYFSIGELGVFGMYYYGDQTFYSGERFAFDSTLDYTGNLSPMLYGSTRSGNVELTSVSVNTAAVSAVPVPAAAWLFGSGLLGLAGIARRRA